MSAAAAWADALASWAIPDEILAAAPASPWGFDVKVFERIADDAQRMRTPSQAAALEVLPQGGSVLDVGCGAGAASLALAPTVGRAVGVDASAEMLAAFAARAGRLGVAHDEIEGRWPDVAPAAPACDVVACHHVVYNVADIVGFVAALTACARRRVVVEMTAVHPLTWMNPLWAQLHGLARPTQPTVETFVALLAEQGIAAAVTRWTGRRGPTQSEDVATVRRRLCLPPERDAEVAAALEGLPPSFDREFATGWWDAPG